jgi:hypothetical protein
MIAIPALLLTSVAVAVGVYLGLLYLRRVRPIKAWLGAHILLGMAGIEQVAILTRGAPNGEIFKAGEYGTAALACFGLAMFSGFTAPLLGQKSRRNGEMMLATHAGAGIAGFVLLLLWLANLQAA